MTFSAPLALLLLLSLPYFVWLARPRRGAANVRQWISLGLRLLIMLLLILSLAGSQMVRAADELAVVFLVDASDSIGAAEEAAAESYVREAMAAMGPDDRAAVVLFGADALVERPMSGLAELAPITSIPRRLHTDLGEAIRLGMALFPAGSARRLVILSDGAATLGQPLEAAELAAAAGIEIDYVPLTGQEVASESWISNVNAPTRVVQGERFTIDVGIESTRNMAATLRVLAGGRVIHEEGVQLSAGSNNFAVRLQANEPEFVRYVVELVPAEDGYYQNNRLAAYTEVVGPPRILLVGRDGGVDEDGNPLPDEDAQLLQALQDAGLPVDRVVADDLPATLPQLSNYASIVLVNVNAKTLSPRKMEALQSYVRDLGGGLVVVGGPESYGMGGYYRTPLEETLPVEMQIKDQDRFPSVSIVIVIDRSGSMAMPEGGVTKIQLADEAAVRVVELLNDFDDITVIPVDTQPDNVIGPVSAADKGPIINEIRQIGAGGGGINVRTGIEAAAEALAASDNEVKHIIVLADGNDSNEQEGVPELIESLVEEGTTLSMVAIGGGKDVPWLQQMAELGQGRFHLTDQAANLPQIFTQETTSIQRSYLIEERFFPTLRSRSPMLTNIRQVPPLYGYVGTSAKGAAQVILETQMGDPLLAAWQYGLGRAVAWTSDATGRWAREWVPWQGFPTFWAQVVRWSITQGRESNVEMVVNFSGEEAELTVDARGSDGSFLNELQMAANVVAPDGEVTTVTLQQVAPGRYQTDFTPGEEGAYLIRVTGTQAGEAEAAVAQTAGWVLGYSPEYRQFAPNLALLQQIAALTGGADVGQDPEVVFAHDLPSQRATRPIWSWLALIAVLLLPVDIAARRLVVSRRDLERVWAVSLGRLRPASVQVQRSQQVARLFEAKKRAGTEAPERVRPTAKAHVERGDEVGAVRQRQGAPAEETAATSREALSRPAPSKQETAEEAPADRAEGTLAARLLARRRQQQPDEE